MNTSQRIIFIVRHGEKPETPPPHGIDLKGNHDSHSLLPLGWQRAGALVRLFAPFDGRPRGGLATPTQLIAPDYEDPKVLAAHRTHETIFPLSQLLGVEIETPYDEGDEAKLGKALAEATTGAVTLICWEHDRLPTIANHIAPVAAGTEIPQTWPGDRFDVVWSFAYDSAGSRYVFSQVPQMLLSGDSDKPIHAHS
jgi:hypothetical protein